MFFRRRAVGDAQCVGFTLAGATASAAAISCPAGEKPKLHWIWTEPAQGMTPALVSLRKQRSLRSSKTNLVLDRGQYHLVSADAPDIPREEWAQAMRWQLKEQVEFPIEDAVLDVLAVPSQTQSRASNAAIALLTPASRSTAGYLQADDAGLSWSSVEVPETALRNVSALLEIGEQAHALMAFGPQYGMLVITFKGELLMARTIEAAGDAVSGSEETRSTALGRAGLEMLRTLDTFERLHSQVSLSGLTVALPEGAEGMTDVLADLVYVPVKRLQLHEHLDLSALPPALHGAASTPGFEQLCAIGAALRSWMERQQRQQIDLSGAIARELQDVPWSASLALKAAGATLGVALAAGAGLSLWTHQMEKALAALPPASADDAPALPPQPPAVLELQALKQTQVEQQRLRHALTAQSVQSGGGYSEFLIALSRQAPGSLWITGFGVSDDGQTLQLKGRMTHAGQLPDYLGRLAREPQFAGRSFGEIELRALGAEKAADAGITEFTLKGRGRGLSPPPPEAAS